MRNVDVRPSDASLCLFRARSFPIHADAGGLGFAYSCTQTLFSPSIVTPHNIGLMFYFSDFILRRMGVNETVFYD